MSDDYPCKATMREFRWRCERRYVKMLLRKHGNKVHVVAKILDLERSHMYRKIRALCIDLKESPTPTSVPPVAPLDHASDAR